MNVIKEIERINASEFTAGIIGGISKGSWHDKYKDSAWVYLGGMTFELSEGDILCVMSQWGWKTSI
jgi:RNA-binding motif protein, X-linked 2